MNRKNLWMAAGAAAFLAVGEARAEDPAPVQDETQQQDRERRRLRDGSGAGEGNRYGGRGEAGARKECDGSMRRDRLRDGSGGGGRQGRMGGRR